MPSPGDYGVLLYTGGPRRNFVEWLIGWGTRSEAVHAFLALDDGTIVEAEPHGARVRPAGEYGSAAVWSCMPLTGVQRALIVSAGRALVGTRYNIVDDIALGLARKLHWYTPRWVQRRLSRPDRLMCSQLVDQAYLTAGMHLFVDGRMTGDVTPGDLYQMILAATPA